MTTNVLMPQLAEGMEAAKVAIWLKRVGEAVIAGEVIAEVETDKTNVELEAPATGVLERIIVSAGSEDVVVGTVLAVIAARLEVSEPVDSQSVPIKTPIRTKTRPEPAAPPPAPQVPSAPMQSAGVLATPLAVRMANLAGLDLKTLVGQSQQPVTKVQVEAALLQRSSEPPSVQSGRLATVPPVATDSYREQPLSAMRRVTASRLQQAKQTIPHFYLEVDCQVDALIALRAQIKKRPVDVSITDMLILAVSRALANVPAANSTWEADAVRVYDEVDIAVAVDTPKGLITPIVRGSHRKSLATISRDLRDLVERARQGHLKPHEYNGGTCTISSLGMFGITRITPIINPPQACILGIGAIEERPVVMDGQVRAGHLMSCTLAADHRAIDGATGAEFLNEFRRFVEDPASMVLYL